MTMKVIKLTSYVQRLLEYQLEYHTPLWDEMAIYSYLLADVTSIWLGSKISIIDTKYSVS